MMLDAIPAGSRVLIDANILIYARLAKSEQCRRLLTRCAKQEISGVATSIVVAEFCHRRMMQEAQSRGLSASNPAKALGQNPTVVRQLTQYAADVEDLLAGELKVLPIERDDFTQALELQRHSGLFSPSSVEESAPSAPSAKKKTNVQRPTLNFEL